MSAHYDDYDYPSYWDNRDYEHKAELHAIKCLLSKVPEIKHILDIGGGYGRLVPAYLYRAKRVTLSDPSSKLLKTARDQYKGENKIKFVQSTISNLPNNLRANSVDLALMVRVLHHIEEPAEAFEIISKILKPKGYLLLEFANKKHFKAMFTEFMHGNLTFPLEIFPKDIRSRRNIKKKTLPFINYHPDIMYKCLRDNGFEIKEVLSVSNIRWGYIKKYVSTETLLSFEKIFQAPFAKFNWGPSIFVLAQNNK